jgi:hypothetical protein
MRWQNLNRLAFAALLAADPAAAQVGASQSSSNPYNPLTAQYNRLIIDGSHATPSDNVWCFSGATPAAALTSITNFYGAGSKEVSIADGFFTSTVPPTATLCFTRWPYAADRARHYSGWPVNPAVAVTGTLSIPYNGFTYTASLSLPANGGLSSWGATIATALNSSRTSTASCPNSTIAPASTTFNGTLYGNYLYVTSVSAGTVEQGGYLGSPVTTSNVDVIGQISGTPGGAGVYETGISNASGSASSATF